MRRARIGLAIALAGAVGVGLLWWASGSGADPEAELADAPDAPEAEPEDELATPPWETSPFGEEPQTEPASERPRWKKRSREEWRQWRERRRQEWLALSPEERRQRMTERAERMVTIEPLGETAPDLEPIDLMTSMRSVGRDIHECVQASGGWRDFWTTVRSQAPDAGPGGRRAPVVRFDVSAEGALDPDSLELDPPPPEPFAPCFVDAWNAVELPPPNAEAHVEVRFGGPGGRRPRGPG